MWTSALPLSSGLSSSLALPPYPARVRQRLLQWRIQGRGPGPLLFLDETEVRRAEKIFWVGHSSHLPPPPPAPLSEGLDTPTLYLNTITKLMMWKHVKKAIAKTQFLKLASFLFQAMNLCSMACRGLGPALPLLRHNRDEETGPKGRNNSSGNPLTMTFHTFLTVNRARLVCNSYRWRILVFYNVILLLHYFNGQ